MAIISASRRTDIPAWYPDWFMNRIRDGHFVSVNPFNSHQVRRVSLAPRDVDAIVFWTKNPQPLLPHLAELDHRGYSYYFQFTLNPYEKRFEPQLPPLEQRIELMRQLSGHVGPARVVWRYDPIIFSNVTPLQFHLDRFETLASQLCGATERLMFSFFTPYAKLKKRFGELERSHGIFIQAATEEQRTEMARRIGEICRKAGLTPFSCACDQNFSSLGIAHGSCIDGKLVAELCATAARFRRDRNQRPNCGCVESIDMGMYDSCPAGCVYCYANGDDGRITRNLARHDPAGSALIELNG